MTQVLLAFDKFKGSLTAVEACRAASKGVERAIPAVACRIRAVADGGEGTLEALETCLQARRHRVDVPNAVGSRNVSATYLMLSPPGPRTAFLELAQASGLTLLAEDERDPLRATTFGTGVMMRAALESGAGDLVIGLGGSATNDAGAGVAQAFGYAFLDRHGQPLEVRPRDLLKIRRIEPPASPTPLRELVVLTDVDNPLLGPQGATAVYGPQKGVTPDMQDQLENGLAHLADLAHRIFGTDHHKTPGAGAAGGCAWGLMTFLGGRVEPGFAYLSRLTGLENAIRESDLILVGEGKLDLQTLRGKAPLGVAELAARHRKPVIAIGGVVEPEALPALEARFHSVAALTGRDVSVDESMQRSSYWLERRAFESVKAWASVTR